MIQIDDQHKAVILAALEYAQADMEHFWYKWMDGVKPSELRAIISAAIDEIAQLSAPAASGVATPDSPGFWAWDDGHNKGVSEVYEGFGNELIVDEEPGGLTPDYFSGRTWCKLTMPWDAQRPPAPALPQALVIDEPDEWGNVRIWPFGREPHLISITVIPKYYERDGTMSGARINYGGYPVLMEDTRIYAQGLLKACQIAGDMQRQRPAAQQGGELARAE